MAVTIYTSRLTTVAQCRSAAARPPFQPAAKPSRPTPRVLQVDNPTSNSHSISRRLGILGLAAVAAAVPGFGGAARAGQVEELVRGYLRPNITSEAALMQLLDARGTLRELSELAATPQDSSERVAARSILPGMAKRLREVGQAAPVVAALANGGDKEEQISALYGGKGDSLSITTSLYGAVGRVVTISGRTIRPEALSSPRLVDAACGTLDKLLDLVPEEALQQAEQRRQNRTKSVAGINF